MAQSNNKTEMVSLLEDIAESLATMASNVRYNNHDKQQLWEGRAMGLETARTVVLMEKEELLRGN